MSVNIQSWLSTSLRRAQSIDAAACVGRRDSVGGHCDDVLVIIMILLVTVVVGLCFYVSAVVNAAAADDDDDENCKSHHFGCHLF